MDAQDIAKALGTTAGAAVSPFTGLVSAALSVIERVIPDPAQKAAAQLQVLQLQQQGAFKDIDAQLQRDLAQNNVNAIEAASPSTYKSGWRPGIGWVCAVALALNYWPRAIAGVIFWSIQCYHAHALVPYPDLGVMDLIGLTGSLLGMSTLRSFDKMKGTAQQ